MSLVLLGLCHGFHTKSRQFNNNTFVDNQILIEVEQLNQYGIAEVKTVVVKLSKAHMEQGIQHLWDQHKGKTVAVQVFEWWTLVRQSEFQGEFQSAHVHLVQHHDVPFQGPSDLSLIRFW